MEKIDYSELNNIQNMREFIRGSKPDVDEESIESFVNSDHFRAWLRKILSQHMHSTVSNEHIENVMVFVKNKIKGEEATPSNETDTLQI